MAHNYQFARPALTVDVAVFALDEHDLQVMLIQRDLTPFAGSWALFRTPAASGTASSSFQTKLQRRVFQGFSRSDGLPRKTDLSVT